MSPAYSRSPSSKTMLSLVRYDRASSSETPIFACSSARDVVDVRPAEAHGFEERRRDPACGNAARAAHTANTIGSPVMLTHSAPRSSTWNGSSSGSSTNAASPMINAASASLEHGGQVVARAIELPARRRTCAPESRGSAPLKCATSNPPPASWICSNGTLETSKMLRTGPWQAIPQPRMISSFWRFSSTAGTMPMSARPDSRRSAHSDGMANDRSKSPRCPPWSHAPHQRGCIEITDHRDAWFGFRCQHTSLASPSSVRCLCEPEGVAELIPNQAARGASAR